MEKKLYPFKFIPIASRRPWGGTALVKVLGKKFIEIDEDGNNRQHDQDPKDRSVRHNHSIFPLFESLWMRLAASSAAGTSLSATRSRTRNA